MNSGESAAAELRDKGLFQTLPFQPDRELTNELVRLVIEENNIIEAEAHVTKPFWLGSSATNSPTLVNARKPGGPLENISEYEFSRLFYYLRVHSELEWTWNETPIGQICRQILAPLSPLVHKFTRISVLLQIPNMAIPSHRDMVPGNTYKNMMSRNLTAWGKETHLYCGEEWLQSLPWKLEDGAHKKNNFMNLKIPISERQDFGKPFVRFNGKKLVYSTGGRAFLLNEVEIEHGADPVDFYRGVIFVDSLLNFEAISGLQIDKVEIMSVEDSPPKQQGFSF